MEFTFFDHKKNKTVVLDAEIRPILLPESLQPETQFSSDETLQQNVTSRGLQSFYEENGELFYVITVIVIYSLSMVFLVGTMYRKKSRQRNVDKEVRRYT